MAKKSKSTKALQQTGINAVVRGGGAIAGAMVSAKLLPEIIKDSESPIRKHAGPILAVLGIAAEALSTNPHVRNLGAGVSTFGILKSADNYMPESMKATIKLGLSGAQDIEPVELDWNRLANEAEPISGLDDVRFNGLEDEEEELNGAEEEEEEELSGGEEVRYN